MALDKCYLAIKQKLEMYKYFVWVDKDVRILVLVDPIIMPDMARIWMKEVLLSQDNVYRVRGEHRKQTMGSENSGSCSQNV